MAVTTGMRGLPDVPYKPNPDASEAEQNRLSIGLESHAKALTDFVLACQTPMTVGIQGDWGTGKTSLMNLMEAELSNTANPETHRSVKPGKWFTKNKRVPRCQAVWFNTWQYSQFANQDSLGISMLWNLVRQIQGLPDTDKWPPHETRVRMKRFGMGLLKASTMVAGGVVSNRFAGVSVDAEQVLKAFESDDEQVDAARLYEKMKEDFSGIVQDSLAATGAEKIVFFIDDLDRLEPVRAIELLEVIKNFIDVEGCVFVLAIDYDVILRGLRKRKGYEGEILEAGEGKSFFDKIIQVPFRMPTTGYRSERFLVENFKKLHTFAKGSFFSKGGATACDFPNARRLIEASVGHNPRSLKRLLNLHSLLETLTRHHAVESGVRKQLQPLRDDVLVPLLVLTATQMAHFRVYSVLARNGPIADLVMIALYMIGDIDRKLVAPEIDGGDEAEDADDEREAEMASIVQAAMARRVVASSAATYAASIQGREPQFRQAVEEVVRLIKLLRQKNRWNDRARRNIITLARLLFQSLDKNNNGVIEKTGTNSEWVNLRLALQAAASTSVEKEEDGHTADPAAPVNFCSLRAPRPDGGDPLLPADAMLHFMDRRNRVGRDQVDEKVLPDYTHEGCFLYVIADGKRELLTRHTANLLTQLGEQGLFKAGKVETDPSRVSATAYWGFDIDDESVRLDDLFEQCRSEAINEAETNEVEMGIAAPTPCCAAQDPEG